MTNRTIQTTAAKNSQIFIFFLLLYNIYMPYLKGDKNNKTATKTTTTTKNCIKFNCRFAALYWLIQNQNPI